MKNHSNVKVKPVKELLDDVDIVLKSVNDMRYMLNLHSL